MKFTVNPFTGELVPSGATTTQRTVGFTYATASPMLLRTTLGNSLILEIVVGIDTPFNGSGWSLSVGDNNNNQRLISPIQVALDKVDKFEFLPGLFYGDRTQINLYLNPGSATTGSGFIYLLEA